MNPKPFHEMTAQEAKSFLEEYLALESEILREHQEQSPYAPMRGNLVRYLRELAPKARPRFRPWGDRLPEDLKKLPDYALGESYFDEDARICLLRMGYFFGESLKALSEKLYWTVGDQETAHAGMPVIAGFENELECPPIRICETAMRRIVKNNLPLDHFLEIFDYWAAQLKR